MACEQEFRSLFRERIPIGLKKRTEELGKCRTPDRICGTDASIPVDKQNLPALQYRFRISIGKLDAMLFVNDNDSDGNEIKHGPQEFDGPPQNETLVPMVRSIIQGGAPDAVAAMGIGTRVGYIRHAHPHTWDTALGRAQTSNISGGTGSLFTKVDSHLISPFP